MSIWTCPCANKKIPYMWKHEACCSILIPILKASWFWLGSIARWYSKSHASMTQWWVVDVPAVKISTSRPPLDAYAMNPNQWPVRETQRNHNIIRYLQEKLHFHKRTVCIWWLVHSCTMICCDDNDNDDHNDNEVDHDCNDESWIWRWWWYSKTISATSYNKVQLCMPPAI